MRIGIFGSEYQTKQKETLKHLFEKLSCMDFELFIEPHFLSYIRGTLELYPEVKGTMESNTEGIEIALSIGGDGTFLRTAAIVSPDGIPILGINTGRLGFLADISTVEIDRVLVDLAARYYKIEERTLLSLRSENHMFKGCACALNEIAVLKRDSASMIGIQTTIDGEYLTTYQGDGLVIATPTGSTAYSLSVNGPIMVPQSKSFLLSPVAPHSLNVRPLVITDDCSICLHVESRSHKFLISLDGRSETVPVGTDLYIEKANYTAKVIKRHDHTFYHTLREKLKWGTDSRSVIDEEH